jgi:hypothetical protein
MPGALSMNAVPLTGVAETREKTLSSDRPRNTW